MEPKDDPNHSMGFTLFFMVYGAKAVLPIDLDYGVPWVKAYDETRTARTHSTSSTRRVTWHSYDLTNTNKPYGATTTETFEVARSGSVTWYCVESKPPRTRKS